MTGKNDLNGAPDVTPRPRSPRGPLGDRYDRLAASDDPIDREIARRQRDRLVGASPARSSARVPSRWAHVPLAELFELAGNTVVRSANGRTESGHEPFHASRSGRCLVIEERHGLWYCRGCRRGGTAVDFVRELNGWSYQQATAWLSSRYGPPAGEWRRQARSVEWAEVWP